MIRFIRHNRLQEPFSDYDKLSFLDLVRLWKWEISPRIKQIPERSIQNNFDSIYTSTEKRTQDTAILIGSQTYKQLSLLNEIYFSLDILVTESEYSRYGMEVVRERVFEYFMLESTRVTIKNQLDEIISFLKTCPDNSLIITHGFLMRYLYLMLSEWIAFSDISLLTLTKSYNFWYMEWFDI